MSRDEYRRFLVGVIRAKPEDAAFVTFFASLSLREMVDK
jgi:hypothetical protein